MSAIISQLLILFSFILMGYILKKKNIVTFKTSSTLSKLEVFLFCPAVSLRSFALNLNIGNVKEKSVYLIVAACIAISAIMISKFLAKAFTKDIYEQGVYSYNFTTGNYGYIGYPLMQALFGEDMLLNMIIFAVPFSLYIYTEGYRVLTGGQKPTVKSVLSNPFLISIALGLIIGLCGIKLPSWISGILNNASNCMAPIAMIITGIVLAEYDILPLLKNAKVYIASVIRLLVIPLVVMLVLKLFNFSHELLIVATFFCGIPAGLNPVIFPNSIGKDCKTGLSMVLVTNLLCIITIPLIISLL